MAELNKQVSDDNDDAGTVDGSWDIGNNWLSLGYDWSEADKFGLRFQNITIPKGATIVSAIVSFYCIYSVSANSCNVKIYAEDADDAAAFSDESNFDGRSLTPVAGIAWSSIPAWTETNWYDSPDIKTAIQNVVNREGWASGQDIAILVKDNSSDEGAARFASDYSENSAHAAKLVITYTVGGKAFSKCFVAC